jgi:hypothetical protein
MLRLLVAAVIACFPLLPAMAADAPPKAAAREAPLSVHDVPVGERKFVFHRFHRKTTQGAELYFVVFENGRQLHAGTPAELRRVPDRALNFALSGVLSQVAVPRR